MSEYINQDLWLKIADSAEDGRFEILIERVERRMACRRSHACEQLDKVFSASFHGSVIGKSRAQASDDGEFYKPEICPAEIEFIQMVKDCKSLGMVSTCSQIDSRIIITLINADELEEIMMHELLLLMSAGSGALHMTAVIQGELKKRSRVDSGRVYVSATAEIETVATKNIITRTYS